MRRKSNGMSNASFEFDLIYEPRPITDRSYMRPKESWNGAENMLDCVTWRHGTIFPFSAFHCVLGASTLFA